MAVPMTDIHMRHLPAIGGKQRRQIAVHVIEKRQVQKRIAPKGF